MVSDTGTEAGCSLIEPDCVKCLRKKLQAVGMAVFFRDQSGWHFGNFQSDKPFDAAEVDVHIMLKTGLPETVARHERGLLLKSDSETEGVFPSLMYLLAGHSVIAAPVAYQGLSGVRIAWRENTKPFTARELDIMQCFGQCPEGCV